MLTGLGSPRVNHCRRDILVPQQSLHCSYIRPTLEQMGGKAVTKCMRTHAFGQPDLPSSAADGFVDHTGIYMMAPDHPGARVLRKMVGRKNILPTPLAACPGYVRTKACRR